MKILLVRLDGLGDALACAPLVAALRDAGHELGVALSDRSEGAFAPDVFRWTHILQRVPWPAHGHDSADIARVLDEARAIAYDVALVASEEPDAYDLARSAARRTVGFHNGFEKPFKSFAVRRKLDRSLFRPASLRRAREHEVQTLFRLGEGLHAESEATRDADRLRPLVVQSIDVVERAREAAFGRAAAAGGIEWPPSSGYVALQLTPKWQTMGIGAQRLAALVRNLRDVAYVRLLVSSEEERCMRAVGDQLDTDVTQVHATVFEGRSGVEGWKRVIADAAVLVTPDTGASHVAGMTGTPCVDVFPDEAETAAMMLRWSPWASRSVLLRAGDDAAIVRSIAELECAQL